MTTNLVSSLLLHRNVEDSTHDRDRSDATPNADGDDVGDAIFSSMTTPNVEEDRMSSFLLLKARHCRLIDADSRETVAWPKCVEISTVQRAARRHCPKCPSTVCLAWTPASTSNRCRPSFVLPSYSC